MKRGGPLKRRESMRDSYARRMRAAGKIGGLKARGALIRKRPPKKISNAKQLANDRYYPLQREFLARPENQWCAICQARRDAGENIQVNIATEVHHWAGRTGRLLCYVPYFRPSCFFCRTWPHDHKRRAREIGVLAPATLYDVFPAEG